MGNKRKYKAYYIADDGTKCSFTFKTDKSFKHYTHDYNQGFGTLGNPFVTDMQKAIENIMKHEDSNMRKHGGFNIFNLKMVEDVETGSAHYFV